MHAWGACDPSSILGTPTTLSYRLRNTVLSWYSVHMQSTRAHIVKLIASVALAQSAGLLGALFTTPNIEGWYTTLAKPALNPPSWVFGPVWTLLYTMMGVSFFLVWTRHMGGHRRVLWLRMFLAHLVVNAAWSIVFFGQHALGWALVVIGMLWVMILALIITGLRLNKTAGYLLLPYLLWVSFASYLNYSIWSLNH